jgi:serine protease Do
MCNRQRFLECLWIIILAILTPCLFHYYGTSKVDASSSVSTSSPPQQVSKIAYQATVRIFGKNISGSGVIISQQNQEYRVITNAHVVPLPQGNIFTILTSDGQVYQAQRDQALQFNTLDLAVLKFRSPRRYLIPLITNYRHLKLKDPVYVGGFPNYEYRDGDWRDTTDEGIQPYRLTTGHVSLLLEKSLEEGYQVGVSNDIILGMSGGPVFTINARLVGIIGRTKFPVAGKETYQLVDGTQIPPRLLEQMEASSWAIPIPQRLQQILINPKLNISK